MDIDEDLIQDDVPHYTELRPILFGSFNLSKTPIPYYQTIMSLEDVAKELNLVENLPADLRSKWKLEELFQREIDWRRVEDSIYKGYLRRPEKLKFFNSLTVALLPLDKRGMLASSYGDTPRAPEVRDRLTRHPWQVTNAGGVQVVLQGGGSNGFLRWDPKRVFAATIDGQHRLAALKMYFDAGNLTSTMLATKVSVIFLVLDERVGFDIPHLQVTDGENPVLTVVREVFIDLNKHSQEVKRTRRILLDDQEIEARCLRQLLASRVGERDDERLPLGLVHWQHNESAKFNTGSNTGPFITTVELLYSIVEDLLAIKKPKNPTEGDDVRKFVKSIEEALRISQVIEAHPLRYQGLAPLMSYVENYYLRDGLEVPFVSLTAPYLRACEEGFNLHWRPLIIGVLTRFTPYRQFIEEVENRGGIEGDLAFYLVLPKKAQHKQVIDWGESVEEKRDRPLRELASLKNRDWPFFAVFQKALLRATAHTWRYYSPGSLQRFEAAQSQFLAKWLDFLNTMSDRGLFAVKAGFSTEQRERVWMGISLNLVSETIRYNESAVQKMTALIVLWWYFYSRGLQQPASFLKKASSKQGRSQYPDAANHIAALKKGIESVVRKTDEELDQLELERRIDARLVDLVALAARSGASGSDESPSMIEEDQDRSSESSVDVPEE